MAPTTNATMPCAHPDRVDGVCQICGDCEHDVILNGACLACGTTELAPRTRVAAEAPAGAVIAPGRLTRGK